MTPPCAPAAAWRCCCNLPPPAISVASAFSRRRAKRWALRSPISSPCSRRPRSSSPGARWRRANFSSDRCARPYRRCCRASLSDVAEIVVREWSEGIWVRGAAAMTLRDLYGAPWGTTGPRPFARRWRRADRSPAMKRVGVGVIGCGNISAAYLKAAKFFPLLDIRALADINPAAAEARGAEFGIPARSVDGFAGRRGGRDCPQPDNSQRPCRSRPAGRRGGKARPFGKAARRQSRRGADAGRRRGGEGRSPGLRARHVSRRRASDFAQADR